jgi:hypothetical protein
MEDHHYHWLDSPWWALAFLRSFAYSSLSRATFFLFLTSSILMGLEDTSFESQQGQEVIFSKLSSPTLGPTQPPIQCVPVFYPGGKT